MENIIAQFLEKEEASEIKSFGSGHINDTYKIVVKNPECGDYLLQRINHKVFENVSLLMDNMVAVTNHLRRKIDDSEIYSNTCQTITILPSVTGQYFVNDSKGNYWRMMKFLGGYQSYDVVETSDQVYYGARSFGQFMMLLDDFNPETIGEVIPGFHNIINRLLALKSAVDADSEERAAACRSQIDYVYAISEQMCTIEKLRKEGVLRERVTHNDTKFNNVLLSPDNKRSCVIDLDTVMPGVVHYDFGDGIRTTASTCEEDEEDLNLVQLNMEKFEAFTDGYLDVTRDILEPVEIQYLALSSPLLSYIMGVRFLTDYLSGDHYYKTQFEGHNLRRAKCQLEFTKKMLQRMNDMERIISKLTGNL